MKSFATLCAALLGAALAIAAPAPAPAAAQAGELRMAEEAQPMREQGRIVVANVVPDRLIPGCHV